MYGWLWGEYLCFEGRARQITVQLILFIKFYASLALRRKDAKNELTNSARD